MPLSEEEQRILQQIERQFYESDPEFAQTVSKATLYRHSARRLQLGVVGFFVGLGGLVALLPINVFLAFGAFLVMLASAFAIERHTRTIGREGIRQLGAAQRAAQLGEILGARRKHKPE